MAARDGVVRAAGRHDSLTGTLLLVEIQHRFGVDVAAEDLNLDSLATLATLATFLAEHA